MIHQISGVLLPPQEVVSCGNDERFSGMLAIYVLGYGRKESWIMFGR